jgi:hypothetical protein
MRQLIIKGHLKVIVPSSIMVITFKEFIRNFKFFLRNSGIIPEFQKFKKKKEF